MLYGEQIPNISINDRYNCSSVSSSMLCSAIARLFVLQNCTSGNLLSRNPYKIHGFGFCAIPWLSAL